MIEETLCKEAKREKVGGDGGKSRQIVSFYFVFSLLYFSK
jgi:hypothetical protein